MDSLPASVLQAIRSEFDSQRSLAWLHVGPSLDLVGAGGCLAHYGLDSLRIGEPAPGQAVFLEGFLPLPESPLRIRSVELAGGRAADLHFHAHGEQSWVVLLDVTAEREEARKVQQKAYEMTLLQEKEARLNRELEAANAALRQAQREIEASRAALQRAHDRLSLELREAAAYVRSILPAPTASPFAIDWRFVPSMQLGGDCFGYHWIDDAHFALYLLDVCGHGIGPSLLSVGVLNAVRSGSLANADPRDPSQVLAQLNRLFPMHEHNELFFTLWYGVYTPSTRRLAFAAAGHPPALLVAAGERQARPLATRGVPIGTFGDATWRSESTTIPEASRLYLFSDGAFEIFRPDGSMPSFDEFVTLVSSLASHPETTDLDALLAHQHAQGTGELADDLSIVRFRF